jgi:membrane protein implicated in regulation of membrane protease activity
MAFFLFLILVALVLGVLGAVVEGLFYLLFIGIVLLVIAAVVLSVQRSRRRTGR